MELFLQSEKENKTTATMAKPIKDTPLLVGEDATRFVEATSHVEPASEQERQQAQEAFDFFSSVATFRM